MAFSAQRSLASGLSRHLTRRLHPSLTHLVPSHHDLSQDPSSSASAQPPPTQPPSPFPFSDLRRRSMPQNLTLPLPFAAHLAPRRDFSSSSGASADAAGGVISDAATSAVPAFPAPFPGEVAVAAADSFLPSAAVQHLIDAVHSFTGLNWWASIALAMVLVRTATTPFVVHQLKSNMKYNALRPEMKALHEEIIKSTDKRTKQEKHKKLSELFRKHGVSRFTPFKLPLVHVPLFLCFPFAIHNMIAKVPSLQGGGAFWFTDLTTPDELYIFPVLISMAYAAAELNIKARLAGKPMQQRMRNMNRVLAVLMLPLSMSICKAHFCYWLPWTLFSFANAYAFRMPAVRQFLDIPLVLPPHVAQVPTEVPKPIQAVDSPPADSVSAEPSSESSDGSVDTEKKRRAPRVVTNREQ